MFTDASQVAWGARLQSEPDWVSDLWGKQWAHEHINVKELKAVHLALQLLACKLQGRHIQLFCDNQVTVRILQNLYTRWRKLRLLLGNVI